MRHLLALEVRQVREAAAQRQPANVPESMNHRHEQNVAWWLAVGLDASSACYYGRKPILDEEDYSLDYSLAPQGMVRALSFLSFREALSHVDFVASG